MKKVYRKAHQNALPNEFHNYDLNHLVKRSWQFTRKISYFYNYSFIGQPTGSSENDFNSLPICGV